MRRTLLTSGAASQEGPHALGRIIQTPAVQRDHFFLSLNVSMFVFVENLAYSRQPTGCAESLDPGACCGDGPVTGTLDYFNRTSDLSLLICTNGRFNQTGLSNMDT